MSEELRGRKQGKGEGKDGVDDGEKEGREMSVFRDDWDIPEMRAKKKRESIGEMIKDSPERAVAIVRRWMSTE